MMLMIQAHVFSFELKAELTRFQKELMFNSETDICAGQIITEAQK